MQVEVATSKRVPIVEGSSEKGMQWQIPTLLGKCKEGSDRNNIQCWVLDFVIHPDTCRMAMNNARFKVRLPVGKQASAFEACGCHTCWNLDVCLLPHVHHH